MVHSQDSAISQKSEISGSQATKKREKFELQPGFTKELWRLLGARFGPLVWSGTQYSIETAAVKTLVQTIPEVTAQDIADFLWYVANCDGQWKANKLAMPLLSYSKKDFGRWWNGGKPKGEEVDAGSRTATGGRGRTFGTAKHSQSEASVREEMEYRASRLARGDNLEVSVGR
jgi:hypothetical protein